MRKRRTRTRSKEGTLRVWLLLSDIINLYGGWGESDVCLGGGSLRIRYVRQFFLIEFSAG